MAQAAMCEQLCKLHDQVPPMSAQQTRGVIERELGGAALEDVFEWIDLEKPLGSASLAQVRPHRRRRPPPAVEPIETSRPGQRRIVRAPEEHHRRNHRSPEVPDPKLCAAYHAADSEQVCRAAPAPSIS